MLTKRKLSLRWSSEHSVFCLPSPYSFSTFCILRASDHCSSDDLYSYETATWQRARRSPPAISMSSVCYALLRMRSSSNQGRRMKAHPVCVCETVIGQSSASATVRAASARCWWCTAVLCLVVSSVLRSESPSSPSSAFRPRHTQLTGPRTYSFSSRWVVARARARLQLPRLGTLWTPLLMSLKRRHRRSYPFHACPETQC